MTSEWESPPAVPFEFAPDDKRKFAAAFLKLNDPLKAATSVFGPAPAVLGKALYAASNWPNDSEVLAHKLDLLENETDTDLPSKIEAARRVWEWTQSGTNVSKEKIAAMELYCNLRGYVDKPGSGVTLTMPPVIKFVRESANESNADRRSDSLAI